MTEIFTAFEGARRLASGPLAEVALAIKAITRPVASPIQVFSDATGRPIDLDLRGSTAEIAKWLEAPVLLVVRLKVVADKLTEVELVATRGVAEGLIFNIDVARQQVDRRPVIDSLPFKEGSFTLVLKDWTRERDKLIPAARWKKVE